MNHSEKTLKAINEEGFCVEEIMTNQKTPKQYLEEVAAIEHDDPTGLYDNISVEGAVTAFVKYLTHESNEIASLIPDDPMAKALFGELIKQRVLQIESILEDLKK
jgi:hypothetical protein